MVYVEGNIGAGKSTVLAKLRELGYRVEPESVNDTNSMFSRALRGPHTFHLQVAACLDMFDRMQKIDGAHQNDGDPQNDGAHHFLERGIAGLETFMHVAKENESMTTLEYDLCTALKTNNEKFIQHQQPEMVLFLDVEPALCLERVRTRNRKGEEGVTLEYLESVQRWYHKLLFEDPRHRFVVAKVKVLKDWAIEEVVAALLAAIATTQASSCEPR